jgi:hypothetical protein
MEKEVGENGLMLRHPARLLLVGLGLGAAFDLLFNGKPLGISVLLFAALLLGGLWLAIRWEEVQDVGRNLWLPAALLFFAAMSLVRANGFLLFLNVSACGVLAALMAVYLVQRSAATMKLPALILVPVEAVVMAIQRGGKLVSHGVRHDLADVPKPNRQQTMPILRGLLMAVPVLIVFGGLLASADLVFADWMEHLFSLAFLEELVRWAGHGVVIVIAGFLLAGGLAYAVRQRSPDWAERLSQARFPRFPGITESAVVINAVNLLFFVFVLIQIPYLFGGSVNIDVAKFTYAQYARRGFGELVAVAILTLGLIVVLSALTPRGGPRQRLAFNLSATTLLGLTCVMLVSAFKRLLMYEVAYGFTQMRIYPHVFMVWLGILLAWFAASLWWRPERFAIGVLVVALGFVGTLDLLNPDALIVVQNFSRYQELRAGLEDATSWKRQVDAYYFAELSEDAVPALVAAADAATGQLRQVIEDDLRLRARAMAEETGWRRWQAYHLARWRAHQLLEDRYGSP